MSPGHVLAWLHHWEKRCQLTDEVGSVTLARNSNSSAARPDEAVMSIKPGGLVVPGIDRKGDDGQFQTLRPGRRIPQQRRAELLAAVGLLDGQAS